MSAPSMPRLDERGARAALAGLAAAAVGLAVPELAAGLVPGLPSLVAAGGSLVIALQPAGAKDLVVGLFGTADKAVLEAAVVVVALLVGAMTGLAARRDIGRGVVVIVAFGLVAFGGAWQAEVVPAPAAALSALLGVAAALVTLRALLPRRRRAATTGADPAVMPDWGRRRFLLTSGATLAGATAAGVLGRRLLVARGPGTGAVAATLPRPAEPVPALTADQSLPAPGLSPIVVPADRFYRIDTALLVPQVDAATWRLAVDGLVAHRLEFSYADLLAMPLIEQYVTIACVSNPVGGQLVGNAKWTGIRLKALLAEAGVQPGASQVVGRSVDGFTVGFPTAWALDPSREPLVALGMDDAPLPPEHGFPARLIVPGLYGYVSATKWLAEIELTTLESFDAYWVRLGWAKQGPILTQSRIDHPRDGEHVPLGPTWIDGVAWAPDRGVRAVEVRVDGGAWQAASLSRAISRATWVQWMLQWQPTPGRHAIEVRATDGTGTIQTDQVTPPPPDGARGHHTISVQAG
ncbi:MAG TPA: molybdopterin-dependent oxidoreductase [Candidatus Limnocylindrales bacterium]